MLLNVLSGWRIDGNIGNKETSDENISSDRNASLRKISLTNNCMGLHKSFEQ